MFLILREMFLFLRSSKVDEVVVSSEVFRSSEEERSLRIM